MKGATFHPQCPNESELLGFYERGLSSWKKARIEQHLVECESCRESIAMMVTLGRAANQADIEEPSVVGEDLIHTQLGRIVAIARNDTARRGQSKEHSLPGGFTETRSRTVLGIPLSNRLMLAAAALVFILLASPVVFWIVTRPSPSREANQALAQAVIPGRRSPVVLSGLPYSPDTGTRGYGGQGDDLMFERAESKVKNNQSTPENRLALARVWLARNEGGDAERALDILNKITTAGRASAEAWNDKGVAEFELTKYDQAITSFTAALTLSPVFREALFNRGVSEETDGRYEEAKVDLKKFISTDPEPNWRREAENKLSLLDQTIAPH